MTASFVTENTQLPTTKATEHKSSASPSTKAKKSNDSTATNGVKHAEHPLPSTSPRVSDKATKKKNVGNADATASMSQTSPKKSSTKQSHDTLPSLTGTPIKHKLADRTNGNDVAKPFSPRKTRSRVSKIAADLIAQSHDSTDAIDKKKIKLPKKLNMDTLNINVAALLPGAKPPKPAQQTIVKDSNTNGSDEPAATDRLVDVNRNRAKNSSRRPPTRTGLKQQYQDSMESEGTAATGRGLKKLKLPQLDGAHDTDGDKKGKAKAKPRPKPKDDANSDSDFEVPTKRIRPKVTPPPKPKNKLLARAKKIDNRVFSTDEENDFEVNTMKMNFWVEAYAEQEKKWIVIDPVHKKVDNVDYVRVSVVFDFA